MISATLYNGGSPVPNFTLTILSGYDSTVLATVDVVNPNGNEPYVTVAALMDQNKVDAVLERGILMIRLDVKEQVKPRTIKIRSE